jgi:hypothetical protein
MNHASDLLGRMPEDELDKMILELSYYASRVRSEYRWRTIEREALPKGETVKSIVSLAVEKVLSGERRWNPEQQSDFRKFMRDVIDSLINHLAQGKDNTLLTPAPEEGRKEELDWHTGSKKAAPTEWLARNEATPEQLLLERESQAQKDEAIQALLNECAGDQILTNVVNAMLEGYDQCREIAAVLGISVKEVYKAMRRLDRKVALVRRKTATQDQSRGGMRSEQK